MGDIRHEVEMKLLAEDPEFRKAYESHRDYERQVEELDKRRYLTTEEQLTRKRLQKMKLAQKDRMEEIISRYKMQVTNCK